MGNFNQNTDEEDEEKIVTKGKIYFRKSFQSENKEKLCQKGFSSSYDSHSILSVINIVVFVDVFPIRWRNTSLQLKKYLNFSKLFIVT